jgi:hypothetical protein
MLFSAGAARADLEMCPAAHGGRAEACRYGATCTRRAVCTFSHASDPAGGGGGGACLCGESCNGRACNPAGLRPAPPACRFGAACARRATCRFGHYGAPPAVAPLAPPPRCRFDGWCGKRVCPFLHTVVDSPGMLPRAVREQIKFVGIYLEPASRAALLASCPAPAGATERGGHVTVAHSFAGAPGYTERFAELFGLPIELEVVGPVMLGAGVGGAPVLACVGVGHPGGVNGVHVSIMDMSTTTFNAALLMELQCLEAPVKNVWEHGLGLNEHPHLTLWTAPGTRPADSNRVMAAAAAHPAAATPAPLLLPLPTRLRGVLGCAIGEEPGRIELLTQTAWRDWRAATAQKARGGGGGGGGGGTGAQV